MAPALGVLVIAALCGLWLLLPSWSSRDALYEAPGGQRLIQIADAPLVVMREAAPAVQIGRVTTRGEPGAVRATLFDGAKAPAALLITEAAPHVLWALLTRAERARLVGSARALLRPFVAAARNLREIATPEEVALLRVAARQAADAMSKDPAATEASAQFSAAFNDAFGPTAKPIAGAFASKLGRSAVHSAGSFVRTLFGAEAGEPQPPVATAALRDPAVHDALMQATETLFKDPRARAALPVLTDRLARALVASPALAEAVQRLFEHPALRLAFEDLARDATGVAVEGFSNFLRISERPELNPVAATLVTAMLRRRPARLVVALDEAELARLEAESARWRMSIYRRSK